jgi:hypothetical protein
MRVQSMKKAIVIFLMAVAAEGVIAATSHFNSGNLKVRSWTILSNNMDNARMTIKTAKEYEINQLQLSHQIVHDLMEIRDPVKRKQVNELTALAHHEGIKDVLLWDHSFYGLGYYPDKFKTGQGGTIDLDNPDFWAWFKQDYRDMLQLVPEINGLVLTFIETGARAEQQYSQLLHSNEEKLAAVIDAVADVVIKEKKLKLYVRTFGYTENEYANTIGAINHVRNKDIVVMMKETPHDFFLTHPNNRFIGKIARPTVVEFDAGNEYSGQGVIANTWPGHIMNRWKDFISRPHVIGYAARTDRYGTTRIVGTPTEILLYALKRTTENPSVSEEQIYDEFISAHYGIKSVSLLKSAFKKSFDIVTSTLYTLGTNMANHSKMDYDQYKSSYYRCVSGKWMNPPVVFVQHGVNRELHYWKDIVEHLAPARYKTADGIMRSEVGYVLENKWVTPFEKMDSAYLNYIITEKQYGVKLASEALSEITKAQQVITPQDYEELYQLFRRTYFTAQLYEAVATAYFGFRLYIRGEEYRYTGLEQQIMSALSQIERLADEIKPFEGTFPVGQWKWSGDMTTALSYKNKILTGWSEYEHLKFP